MSFEEERKFLHDVANPLSIAHGNLRIAVRKLETLKEQNPAVLDILDRLSKAMDACEKMSKQVGDRRQVLLEQKKDPAAS